MDERSFETTINTAVSRELRFGVGVFAETAKAVWEEGSKDADQGEGEQPGFMRIIYDTALVKANHVARRIVSHYR